MKNPPTVKTGDRVRVVLEGDVTLRRRSNTSQVPDYFNIGSREDNSIFPDAEHVVSIEVLKPPIKVGDLIETDEALSDLPGGTIIVDRNQEAHRRNHATGLWMEPGGSRTAPSLVLLPARIVHVYED